MKRTYKTYPLEFKQEAVVLVNEQGYSVQQAADSLGIRSNMLYKWKDKLEAEKSDEFLSQDDRAELRKLRKDNKELGMKKCESVCLL